MKKVKGILLITVIITIVIIVMFMAVIVGDLKVGMLFSGNFAQQEKAYWASMSGLAYAEHMIGLNSQWRANSTAIPISTREVTVEEQYAAQGVKQQNAAHGVLNGESEFYIAFGNLDGNKKIIPVKDLKGNVLSYYSHNYLFSQFPMDLPIDLNGDKRNLPPQSLYVTVEGRSDKARCIVEALYLVNYSLSLPAAAISAGEMNIQLKDPSSKLLITHSAGDNPHIRSNESITVDDTGVEKRILDLSSGKAYAKSEIRINDMSVTRNNQTEFGINAELNIDSSDAFPRLTWDQVIEPRGNPDDRRSSYNAHIDAGTYTFLEDKDRPGKYNLRYFPDNYSKDFIPSNNNSESISDHLKGLTVPKNGVDLDPSELMISTDSKTAVEKVRKNHGSSLSSFALLTYDWDDVSRSYKPSTSARSKFLLQKSTNQTIETSLCTNGDICIKGELSGSGTVLSGGSIDFEPKSQLIPDPEIGLAVYAKGDINIHDMTVTGQVSNPNSYFNQALNNHISWYGDYFYNIYSASYSLLNTYIKYGKGYTTLGTILQNQYGFNSWESRALVMKLLMKNTERSGSLYKIIPPDNPNYSELEPGDALIKGVIYTWKNFNADTVGGSITLRGAVVAYGGNPEDEEPGEDRGSGKVIFNDSKFVNIIYDPNYLGLLGIDGLAAGIRRVLFNRLD